MVSNVFRHSEHLRIRCVLIGAVAVLVALGLNTLPHAAARATPKERNTKFRFNGPPIEVGTPFCDTSGHCLVPATRNVTMSGDWSGTAIEAGATTFAGPRFFGSPLFVFTGTIKGCGTGTVVVSLIEVGKLADSSATGRWRIVEGFGTDGLANARGSGTGSGSAAEGSVVKGKLRC